MMVSSGSVRDGFFALGAFELVEALVGFAATNAGKEFVGKANLAETEEEAKILLLKPLQWSTLLKNDPTSTSRRLVIYLPCSKKQTNHSRSQVKR